jgi:hypothetical protein
MGLLDRELADRGDPARDVVAAPAASIVATSGGEVCHDER